MCKVLTGHPPETLAHLLDRRLLGFDLSDQSHDSVSVTKLVWTIAPLPAVGGHRCQHTASVYVRPLK